MEVRLGGRAWLGANLARAAESEEPRKWLAPPSGSRSPSAPLTIRTAK